MSKGPREWPNVSKEARDRSAELAVEGIGQLEPIIKRRPMTELEKYARISIALNNYQTIARFLESVGACTRP